MKKYYHYGFRPQDHFAAIKHCTFCARDLHDVDVKGGVDGLGDTDLVSGGLGVHDDAGLASDGQEARGGQGVEEGETGGGREAHRHRVLVVQLRVIEVLALTEFLSDPLDFCKRNSKVSNFSYWNGTSRNHHPFIISKSSRTGAITNEKYSSARGWIRVSPWGSC